MEYRELMKGLGDRLGFAEFEADREGKYSVKVDEIIVSFLEMPDSRLLNIIARIGEMPVEDGELAYRILLTSMAPGKAAEAYAFFITADRGIYLRRTEALDNLNVESLYHVLEDYASAREEWHHVLENLHQVLPDINEAITQQNEEEHQFVLNSDGFLRI